MFLNACEWKHFVVNGELIDLTGIEASAERVEIGSRIVAHRLALGSAVDGEASFHFFWPSKDATI